MSKIKILHVADIHIGYTTHGRHNPSTGKNTRVEDFARCLQKVTQTAIDEQVDIVLICGDIYRDTNPSQSDQLAFAGAIKPILQAGIPVVMVTGNHDNPVGYGRAATTEIYGALADVRVMSRPTATMIDTKSGPVYVIGMPWPTSTSLKADPQYSQASREDLNAIVVEQYGQWLNSQLRDAPKGMPAVIAAHLEISGAKLTEGSERSALATKDPVFPVSMLARHEVDYVALGHIHMHQDLNGGAKPPVVYSGSIERISFNEEGQPKGFVLAEIERGWCQWRHVQTPARKMVTIDINPTPEVPEMGMMELINSEIAFAHGPAHDLADAIVRIRITCSEEQRKGIRMADVRNAIRECEVDAIAGIEVDVTDKAVRTRAPELKREAGVIDTLATYLQAAGKSKTEQARLLEAASELDIVE